MEEFYCGYCGKVKNLSAKCVRKGRKPICASCLERAIKIAAKSDATRDKQRRYAIQHNPFNVEKVLIKET